MNFLKYLTVFVIAIAAVNCISPFSSEKKVSPVQQFGDCFDHKLDTNAHKQCVSDKMAEWDNQKPAAKSGLSMASISLFDFDPRK